jgi:hypothetical protein
LAIAGCRIVILATLVLGSPVILRGQAEDNSTKVDQILSKLKSIQTQNGQLTLNDFTTISRPDGQVALSRVEMQKAWKEFTSLLKPPISKTDLKVLHQAVRDSILDLRVVYRLRASGKDYAGEKINIDERREFAIAGPKVFRGRSESKIDDARSKRDEVIAYDGQLVRSSLRRPDGRTSGSVDVFRSRSMFYELDNNLLTTLMMTNSKETKGIGSIFHDFIQFLEHEGNIVLEERSTVDGTSCITVGCPDFQVYLDPNHNYAITKFEHFIFPSAGPAKRKMERRMSEFEDCGNSIWLPKQVRSIEFDEQGGIRAQWEISVMEWQVNKGLPDGYFSDVIPRGALVLDAVRGASYVAGRPGNIEGMLEPAIKPVEGRGARVWVLIGLNIAVATLAAVVIGRRVKARVSR